MKPWECRNQFKLVCVNHGESLYVPCGRWKTCPGCQKRKAGEIRARFLAGMREVPKDKRAMFITLTFPRSAAPDEDEAHAALRRLVARLRYRGYLGAYGWVLQRQGNGANQPDSRSAAPSGTLHYHGVFHLPWFKDGLAEWRSLVKDSGFGTQQNIKPAKPRHAGYVARYIAGRLAQLEPVRRAFSFSRDFPRADFDLNRLEKKEQQALLAEIGVEPEHDWAPASVVASWFR